jgi:hypothetical protein
MAYTVIAQQIASTNRDKAAAAAVRRFCSNLCSNDRIACGSMPHFILLSLTTINLLVAVSSQSSTLQSQPATQNQASGCSPACSRGTCRQAINSQEYYCDCTGTGYSGTTCSVPGSATSTGLQPVASPSAAENKSAACAPACQNGGLCKQEVNSAAYYCDCSGTDYTGLACTQSQSATSPSLSATGQSTACIPACQNGGLCKQEVNSAAYYCDCSSTNYSGLACTQSQPATAPSVSGTGQSSACIPACQNGGFCKQEVNSAAYYCDCSSTGYGGVACTQFPPASAPSLPATGQSAACIPACQNGGQCKQEVNSAAYYCDCSGTGYSGVACGGPASSSPSFLGPASPVQAAAPGCSPACQNGACVQAINSGAFYCDCSATAFTGVTCSRLIQTASQGTSSK